MTAESVLRARYANRLLMYEREGIHEVPDHSNRTRLGKHFGWDGVAWCGITQTEAFFEEFGYYLTPPGPNGGSASVAYWIQWAKSGKYGLRWIPRERAGELQVGDLATYDSGRLTNPGNPSNFHINQVTAKGTIANGPTGFFIGTGGNESDAVRSQRRDGKYLQGGIVLPWDDIARRLGVADHEEEDDEMKYPAVLVTTTDDDPDQSWYITDGVVRRELAPGENQLLADLGLVEVDAKGKPVVKNIPARDLKRIPLVPK